MHWNTNVINVSSCEINFLALTDIILRCPVTFKKNHIHEKATTSTRFNQNDIAHGISLSSDRLNCLGLRWSFRVSHGRLWLLQGTPEDKTAKEAVVRAANSITLRNTEDYSRDNALNPWRRLHQLDLAGWTSLPDLPCMRRHAGCRAEHSINLMCESVGG